MMKSAHGKERMRSHVDACTEPAGQCASLLRAGPNAEEMKLAGAPKLVQNIITSHWCFGRTSIVKMGVFDYLSDLYDSLTIQSVQAEEPQKDDGKFSYYTT
jgi:hypothetical protein